jgi:hypothetical protein
MNMLKQRGDLERERDKLANLVEGMCHNEHVETEGGSGVGEG